MTSLPVPTESGATPDAATTAQDQALAKIAAWHFNVQTLKPRNSDSLDFHEVGVWSIKAALDEAYAMGREAGRKPATAVDGGTAAAP